MTCLLTSDWHLDDQPANEYRWKVFEHLTTWIEHQRKTTLPIIYHLGDLTDRKDRHSSALVNRLIDEFARLVDLGASIWILKGNHDQPLNGPAFWQILDYMRPGADVQSGVSFVTKPTGRGKLLLLPFADNPAAAWEDIDFSRYHGLFMHQTVTGVVSNNGHLLEAPNMVKFPRGLRAYSGDIHTPQIVSNGRGRVRYVGAPHPVAFGDDYPCRMLELDNDYRITEEIRIPTIQKLMLRIDKPSELRRIATRQGDQAKVICRLAATDIDKWPAMTDQITAWARTWDVALFSIEPAIEGALSAADNDNEEIPASDPEYILRLFADAEDINDRLFDTGIKLLQEIMQ